MREAKENAAEQWDLEKHNLMAKNLRLENEVKNLKSLLSSDGEGISSRPRMLSGLSDAVVSAIRRNTVTSQSSLHEVDQTANDAARSLEESMEKVWILTSIFLHPDVSGVNFRLDCQKLMFILYWKGKKNSLNLSPGQSSK